MNTLTPEAIDLLHKMLAIEVQAQVRAGKGEEPMPRAWTELHTAAILGDLYI